LSGYKRQSWGIEVKCGHLLRSIFPHRRDQPTGYSNPDFDKLIEEEQRTGDPKKRVAVLQQAGRIIMEDAPIVPLYTLAEIYGVARNIIWKGNPNNEIIVSDMKIKA
jgi:peptide/nickel transport system substrate-binding protein